MTRLRKVNLIAIAASAFAFGIFTIWSRIASRRHGATWIVRDALMRVGGIGAGGLFLVGLGVARVPWALDRLERGSFTSFVAARHVRARKSGFLTVISGLSIFA